MKYFLILFFFCVGHITLGQDGGLLQHKKFFDTELKQWTATFSDFSLSAFKALDTIPFDNNYERNIDYYKQFLSIYKPIITYSTDSSKFIDIYSYQLNLEKRGSYYYANPDIDQTIFLCIPQKKYWNRIYFGTSSQWIEEVVWISNTKFILAGITKSAEDKKRPLILVCDTERETLVRYVDDNKKNFQSENGYTSPKLKKIEIKGL